MFARCRALQRSPGIWRALRMDLGLHQSQEMRQDRRLIVRAVRHRNTARQSIVRPLERSEHHPLAPDLRQRRRDQRQPLPFGNQAQQNVMIVRLGQCPGLEVDTLEERLAVVMKARIEPPFEAKQHLLAKIKEPQRTLARQWMVRGQGDA